MIMNLIKGLNILILTKIQKKKMCFLPKNKQNKQLLICLLNLNYLTFFRESQKVYIVYTNYFNKQKIKMILKLSLKKKINIFFLKKYYSFFSINNFLILTSQGLLLSHEAVKLNLGGFIIAYLY